MLLRLRILLAAIAIAGAALAIYRPILLADGDVALYPWGSDTLGHLLKVEFIADELKSGNIYPQLFPDWYSGVQLLRYHPPLPYYILVGIFLLSNDIVFAGGAFVFGAALLGGLSFLLYRRWLGLLPATLAGILFMAMPDNIRVALAEGNLPRALATALLPVTFYLLLSTLTQGPSRARFVLLAFLTMLIILAHAMMGAIFVACFTLVSIVYWFTAHPHQRAVAVALTAIYSGVLLSGWWLLPSLTGGITELNTKAAGEALASFPFTVTLDPLLRHQNIEVYYIGLSLVVGAGAALVAWGRLDRLNRSLIVAALPLFLVSTTAITPAYRTLPLHELMWPIRFMSFAGFILLLGIMMYVSRLLERSWKARLAALTLIAMLVVDVIPSLSLIFVRPASKELVTVAEKIRELPGWRVATADFSRLGSRASYRFSDTGEREQVYGWAYQGSGIAPVLASVNFAMERGYSAYAVDRLEEMGADYVVKLKGIPIDPAFDELLTHQGYTVAEDNQSLILYYRQGEPRAYVTRYSALGIGGGAESLALLFPQVAVASSPRVDDYSLEVLQDFPTLVLSGFSWNSKTRAEELIRQYVRGGGKLIVDLTSVPEDILSRRPKFLGVYGEPLQFYSPPALRKGTERLDLQSFDSRYAPWRSLTPQGLDGSTVTFSYLGREATAVGYKAIEGERVQFLGLNLAFHTLLTKDPAGVSMLEEVLGLEASALPYRQAVPLEEYSAGAGGYTFRYNLAQDSPLLLPIAYHDGTTVFIDGQEVKPLAIGNLIYVRAPAGTHAIRVGFRPTPIYNVGFAATAVAVLFIAGMVTGMPRRVGRFLRQARATRRGQLADAS